MRVAASFSIVIPMAAQEPEPTALFEALGSDIEIILSQEAGRAASLNAGAAKATGTYLWFLHADSKLPDDAWQKLQQAITDKPKALHYFDLAFTGGGWVMKINSWGANMRARFFGIPFGAKWILIFAMLIGRLELFTVLVLVMPQFWKK